MSPWQIARQIAYLLKGLTWPDGAQEKVLGSVVVTAGAESAGAFGSLNMPICLIQPGSSSTDDENPSLVRQDFNVAIMQEVYGDPFGEAAIIGGVRTGGQGASDGRGVLEIEEAVFGHVIRRFTGDGVNIRVIGRSSVNAGVVEDLGHVVQRSYGLEALCNVDRAYHPPQRLAKSGSTVSWTLPPDRFDRYKIILNRVAGSTPPTSPSDGTVVALGSDLATSVSDATSGAWTYAVWCAYDETHDGTPANEQRYSAAGAQIPGTTLTVG